MCVIINLPAGKNVPYKQLEMAVWNNPHGYGLVTVLEDGTLDIKKEFFEEGTDPKYIDGLLRENDKYHRYLHLRWKTEGELSLDNVHPFEVYKKGNKEVVFMHNGTLHDYKPKDQKDTRSDTKIFADTILTPFLKEVNGNYCTDIGREILKKFFGYGSRGMLISNFQAPYFFNLADWKAIDSGEKEEDGTPFKYYASNDDYFTILKRGFVFERIEAQKKKAAEEAAARESKGFFQRQVGSPGSWPFTRLKDIDFSVNKPITPEMERFFEDADLYEDSGLATLEHLTEVEVEHMVQEHPDIASGILILLTSAFARVVGDNAVLEAKHERASKKIEELVKKLGEGK